MANSPTTPSISGPLGINPAARQPGGVQPGLPRGVGAGPVPVVRLGPGSASSVPSAPAVNNVASTAVSRLDQVAAENAVLSPIYGRQMLGAQLVDVLAFGGNVVVFICWGEGPVNSIESLWLDQKQLGVDATLAGITATHYTGTQVAADATLIAAYAAQSPSITYSDILPNIAYSVVTMPPNITTGFPRFAAIVQGLKVFDPRENRFTRSNELTTSPWTNTLTSIVQGAAAPDGTLTAWTLTDSSAVAMMALTRAFTVANDSAAYGLTLRVKKTAGGTSPTFGWTLALTGGTGISNAIRLDTDTGTVLAGTATCLQDPRDAGWWLLSAVITNNTTGNTALGWNAYPATAAHGSAVDAVATTGAAVICWTGLAISATPQPYTAATSAAVLPVTAYSDNPALAIGDLQTNATYGAGALVDWPSVAYAANACDELVGGTEKRRTIGLVMDSVQDINQWFEAFRAYAGCFLSRVGGKLYLTPDRPTSSTFTLSETAGTVRVTKTTRRSKRDVPTVSAIRYTDTTVFPWRDNIAYAYAAGAQAGTVPWKIHEVALPGIIRFSQANREAVEQLNKLQLTDLVVEMAAQDQAISIIIGDVGTVTSNLGLSARLMRILGPATPEIARPTFVAEGYDPAVYCDVIAAGPTIADTTLPNPTSISSPTALVIVETVYSERITASTLAGGMVYQSRFDVSWTAPANGFPVTYRVEVYDGATKIRDEPVGLPNYSSPAVQQGKTYTINVYARNTIAESTTPLTGSKTALGKLLAPGNIPAVRGRVLGGYVLLDWDAAIDIDIMRYEWRYFPNGTGSWASATFIDRIDGQSARFAGLPVGTHRFYGRAIDSVGNYSPGDVTIDLTVTSDANSFLQTKSFVAPTLANMISIPMIEGVWTPRWETAITGDQWSTVEPSPLNSGGNAVDSYHAAGTSSWTGESWDLGSTVTGDWTLTANVQDDSGTATYALQTSPDGSTWTSQPGISWKGSTRFIRPLASTTGSMIVTAAMKIQLAAQSKPESGQVTTSASIGTLVQLANQYSGAQDLQATAIDTSSPRFCVANRLLLHPQIGLMLQSDTTAGDAFTIQNISSASYAVVAGDFLEYDVFIDPSTPAATTFSDGGLTLVFSDASTTSALNDADGFNCVQPATGFDVLARGMWKSRKVAIGSKAGLSTTTWRIRMDSDGVGTHKVLFRNIRITDGGSTVRVTAYDGRTVAALGEPTVNTTFASALSSNMKCGPSNSFQLYDFTDAGAQVAQLTQWSFKGY